MVSRKGVTNHETVIMPNFIVTFLKGWIQTFCDLQCCHAFVEDQNCGGRRTLVRKNNAMYYREKKISRLHLKNIWKRKDIITTFMNEPPPGLIISNWNIALSRWAWLWTIPQTISALAMQVTISYILKVFTHHNRVMAMLTWLYQFHLTIKNIGK